MRNFFKIILAGLGLGFFIFLSAPTITNAQGTCEVATGFVDIPDQDYVCSTESCWNYYQESAFYHCDIPGQIAAECKPPAPSGDCSCTIGNPGGFCIDPDQLGEKCGLGTEICYSTEGYVNELIENNCDPDYSPSYYTGVWPEACGPLVNISDCTCEYTGPPSPSIPAPPIWPTPNHTGNTTSSITWDWDISTGANYYVIYNQGGELIETLGDITEYTQTTVKKDGVGLISNNQYGVKVAACNMSGCSDFSPVASAYTSANVPVNLQGTVISQTQINWLWASGGAQKDFYAYDEVGDTSWTASASWNQSGLTCNTAYNLKVKARNGDNDETAEAGPLSRTTQNCPIPNQLPIANASAGGQCDISLPYIPGTSVQLKTNEAACPSSDDDGTITKFEWDFTNDGTYDYTCISPPPNCNTNQTYASQQIALLKVTDDQGAEDTDSVLINICAIACVQDTDCGLLQKCINPGTCAAYCEISIVPQFWREILPKF